MASAGEKSLAVGHIPGFQIDPKERLPPAIVLFLFAARRTAPLSYDWGQRSITPEKNRGEPPTGVLPAAPETAYHKIRQIARKTPVRVVRKYPTQQNAPAAQYLRRRGQLLLLFHQISQRYAIEIAADAFVQLAPDRQRRTARRPGAGLRAAL